VVARVKPSFLLAGLPLILLPLLAVLQYRWIGEVSAAERDRLESNLRVASDHFASDFDSEFARLSSNFQFRDGFPESGAPVLERYQNWSETSGYPRLIRNIYLLKTNPNPDGEPEFNKVDLQSGELEPAPIPKELQNVRGRFRPGNIPPVSGDSMFLVTNIFRRGAQFPGPRGDGRPRPPQQQDFARNPRFGRGRTGPGGPGGGGLPGAGGQADGAFVIELDRDVILKDMGAGLVEKHFTTHDDAGYRIAVVSQGDTPRVLYSSEGEWKPEDLATPDLQVNVFGPPPPPPQNGPSNNSSGPGNPVNPGNPGNRRNPRNRGGLNRIGFQGSLISQTWTLLAKNRAGSLERAVDQVRRRDLAASFGILVVLAAGLITVVISSQRAHTLGRLQMEFAAGVSHELRTPLAVIRSAAHNLLSGVVSDKEGIEQYAAIVQEEARRLSDMVEEVLLYSETQSGRKKYKLEPVDINEVIDRAITNISPSIDLARCEFTTQIDPDLPPVKADTAGLTQCLQNLLNNAVKYGKNGDKVYIEIVGQKDPGANEVRLSVVDQGPGIDPLDQRHLFEPFYRGERVESNIPGNGLGLHLVKRIMQAQGGRVTFSPAPDKGACFTLHIPIAS
jgi:signal transduction histidine kinase